MNNKIKKLRKTLDRTKESLLKHITKSHNDYMPKTVIFEARNLASKGLPKSNDSSVEPYTTSIRSFYNGLKRKVSLDMRARIQKVLGQVSIATIKEKIDSIEHKVNSYAVKITSLEYDKNRIHLLKDYSQYWIFRWVLLPLGIAECIWTATCFVKLIGDNVLLGGIAGVAIGASQILAIKAGVPLMKDMEDTLKRATCLIVFLIFFILLSVCLGELRYYTFHKGAGYSIPFTIINPFLFALINLLFLFTTALIVQAFYPSHEEMKKLQDRKTIEDAIKKLHEAITEAGLMITELINEREEMIEFRTLVIHNQDALYEIINELYAEAIGAFIHENAIKRNDGVFPECFKIRIEPLANDSFDFYSLITNQNKVS